jgi:hypothetical protein
VVLTAAVRATRDVDADTTDLGQALLLQPLADGLGETTRLGDRDVAGVGTGAGHHVTGQLGTGTGHVDRLQPVEEHPQLRLGEATEHHVLTVAEPDVGPQLALDRRQRHGTERP